MKWFDFIEFLDKWGHKLGYIPLALCDYYDRLIWENFSDYDHPQPRP